jgi:hypothetical protein
MTALRTAIEIYAQLGRNFAEVHGQYSEHGYVFSTPQWLIMARPVRRDNPGAWLKVQDIGQAFPSCPEADAWYVQIAVGRGALGRFVQHMPFHLPFICWRRSLKDASQRLRFYRLDRVLGLIS